MQKTTASFPPTARQIILFSNGQWVFLILGVILFERLFWHQQLGINGLLYMCFAVGTQLWTNPWPAPGQRPFLLVAGGTLLSGALMALYGSWLSGLAGWISMALMLGFARLPALRSVGYALLTSLANVGNTGALLTQALRPLGGTAGRAWRGWFYGRLLLAPMLLLILFHHLFAMANPRYDALSSRWLAGLWRGVNYLLEAVSISHLLFWLLAFVVALALVVRSTVRRYAEREARCTETVLRQRQPGRRLFRLPDLRKQYFIAIVLFGVLNTLLLLVNIIDVNWLWWDYQPATALEMKQFVHEGTYVLIFSILLAMGIVLWAFRGNLNFYAPGLAWLRWLATVWVVQNAVLAISVGLRNYYYILATGLAYRRIGVCAFLVLTLFGLATIGLKIWQRRSVYSLVRLNGWAAYALLLLLAAGNWEVWMVTYNVQRSRRHIDLSFLLSLPGRTLPAMRARQAVLAAPANTSLLVLSPRFKTDYSDVKPVYALGFLTERTQSWCAYYRAHRSWQSWNYADWRAYQQLQKPAIPKP